MATEGFTKNRGKHLASLEFGNYHDNAAALEAIRLALEKGGCPEALPTLERLLAHIEGTADPKSKRLLPIIRELFAAYLNIRDPKESDVTK